MKIRGGVSVDSKGKAAGKGPLLQCEKSGCLGASQDQTLFVSYGCDCGTARDVGKLFLYEESKTLVNGTCPGHHNHIVTYALEGNGQRPSHRGDGWIESDNSYTLNTTEIHGVAYAKDD